MIKLNLVVLLAAFTTAASSQLLNTAVDQHLKSSTSIVSLSKQLKSRSNNDTLLLRKEIQSSIAFYTDQKNTAALAALYHVSSIYLGRQGAYKKAILDAQAANTHYGSKKTQLNQVTLWTHWAELYFLDKNPNKAMQLLFEKLRLVNGNKLFELLLHNKIGTLFKDMDNPSKSLPYLLKAEENFKALKEPDTLAISTYVSTCKNTGVLYRNDNKSNLALAYFDRGLEFADKIGDEGSKAIIYNSLGIYYTENKQYDIGLGYYQQSLDIKLKLADSIKGANTMANMAEIFLATKRYDKAEKYLLASYEMMKRKKFHSRLENPLEKLIELYEITNKPLKAYPYLKELLVLKSTTYENNMKSESAKLEAIYQNEKKSQELKYSNLKNSELKKNIAFKTRQRNQLFYGLLVVVLLFCVALWSYIGKRKANKLLESKNKEIQQQKLLLEQHHKEIVDSINYAQRIQNAIIPSYDDFKNYFSDCGILFRPKDIVSGDFYWLTEKSEYLFYATVDCTGHGVPGGFMSVLATSLLNEIVNELNILEPDEILNNLRQRVILALRQKGQSGENQDGMDMVLCRLHKKTNELSFAAANNPVWILQNGEIKEYKADKFPVGISPYENTRFQKQQIKLEKNDIVYTFTDGYADQFGGSKGKKFKYSNLQKFLIEQESLNLHDQFIKLEKTFLEWKGDLEQIDDVCVIGIKI